MNDISKDETQKLKNFIVACNEMIDGKFILSDIKIAKILKAIAGSILLYNLFTKSLVDFNFELEMRNAKTSNRVNGGYFKMPNEHKKIIALVFCLLLEVDNKKIKLQQFITDNFYSSEGYNISYSNFSMVMLVPFKNAVLNAINIKEDGSLIKEIESEKLQKNQIKMGRVLSNTKVNKVEETNLEYANLRVSLNELANAIRLNTKLRENEKQELLIIVNAIFDCMDEQKVKIIMALTIAFEHTLGKNKIIAYYYNKYKKDLISILE